MWTAFLKFLRGLTGNGSTKFNVESAIKPLSTEGQSGNGVLKPSTENDFSKLKATLKETQVISQPNRKGQLTIFTGADRTGKTLAAQLLGKDLSRSVYRIDLSQVVSKYIGETEKNIAKVFERASNKNWILFFDEADALFGKRTNVKDSNDKYANQEVVYLLQRIESYQGLSIIATNRKESIDDAFQRRIISVIDFD